MVLVEFCEGMRNGTNFYITFSGTDASLYGSVAGLSALLPSRFREELQPRLTTCALSQPQQEKRLFFSNKASFLSREVHILFNIKDKSLGDSIIVILGAGVALFNMHSVVVRAIIV